MLQHDGKISGISLSKDELATYALRDQEENVERYLKAMAILLVSIPIVMTVTSLLGFSERSTASQSDDDRKKEE